MYRFRGVGANWVLPQAEDSEGRASASRSRSSTAPGVGGPGAALTRRSPERNPRCCRPGARTLAGLPQIRVAIGAGHAFKFAALGSAAVGTALGYPPPYPIDAAAVDAPP